MKHLQIFIITLFLYNVVFSQKSFIYLDKNSDYKRGLELYNIEKYSSAQKFFQKIIEDNPFSYSEIVVNSTYYNALCAVKLHNKDGEQLLCDFIEDHPESPKINQAYLQLGNYYFHEKKYENSLACFEKVDKYSLTKKELPAYYFNLGYSYFMDGNFDTAKVCFFEIKDANTEYSASATYYYAHIAYLEKNYQTALMHFKKIQKDANFSMIVPYYITQLYYFQEKYDFLLSFAPALLDTATPKNAPEIARMIGDAYYKTKKFKQSIHYLEIYRKQATDVKREDIYQLGLAYYKADDYKNAIKTFESIINVQDSLTQNAYYQLGNCYLQVNDKKSARNAFLSASKLTFDTLITEDALFNYTKISYELSINPYNEAIKAIQSYIDKYPTSPKNDELYKYLVNIYLTTRNYKDALVSIEKIKTKDIKLQEAYQKIAYYRGIELFNNQDYISAISLFDKSSRYSIDKNLFNSSKFWKAECYYRLKPPDYNQSIALFKEFLLLPGVFETPLYTDAHYNLGYCYFQKKDYKEANIWFQKFLKLPNIQQKSEKLYNDALIRIADCYFITRDYTMALEWYSKACNIIKTTEQDYALFQTAITLGILGKINDKTATLQKLLETYSSPAFANKKKIYEDDAIFHLAETYFNNKDYENAYKYFSKITTDFTKSSYYLHSLLKIGLLEYNNQQTNVALEIFEQIVNKYPSTEEFNEAMESIEKIYISMGDEEGYLTWRKKMAYDISKAKEDSIVYQSAENVYIKGDCPTAVQKFNNYLTKFEKGAFTTNVHFYIAECEYMTGNLEKALQNYLYVIKQPKNIFTEKSVLNVADIYFTLKKYAEAAIHYFMLEEIAEYPVNIIKAQIGQMRCYYLLNNCEKAIENANKLLKIEPSLRVEESVTEANITIARCALTMNNLQLALKHFEITYNLAKSELKAEAKYNIAYIYYLQGNYEKSEKIIFEQINELPDYDYWLAKAFILLADNYVKMNNTIQAKYTLQSIIDNYKGEDLVNIAKEKLNTILEAEKEKEKPEEKKIEEEIEISPIDTTK